uniref:Uncharacterized protein n=2 Tax=Amphimedon queenslandica TaxID=400682 RepID=A0A1X7VRW9_AMPQE
MAVYIQFLKLKKSRHSMPLCFDDVFRCSLLQTKPSYGAECTLSAKHSDVAHYQPPGHTKPHNKGFCHTYHLTTSYYSESGYYSESVIERERELGGRIEEEEMRSR